MTSKDVFEPVTTIGWRMGFSTLLRKELTAWFGSSNWWKHAIIWSAALVLVGVQSIPDPRPDAGMFPVVMMATVFPPLGTIILSHEMILEEKKSGSAAWILSKPVSRTAFILAKFMLATVGFSISMVFIPGFAIYLVSISLGLVPDISIYLMSLIPLILWEMFLAFLTLCMGTFFEKAVPTMILPFVFLLFGFNISEDPIIGPFGPWGLYKLSFSILTKGNYPIYPIVVSCMVLVLLVVISIWRFQKYEF
jgi:ABC-2 type transport system permease protein